MRRKIFRSLLGLSALLVTPLLSAEGKVTVGGQVSPAVAYINDGKDEEGNSHRRWFIVDNTHSGTRLSVQYSNQVSEDMTLGANFLFGIRAQDLGNVTPDAPVWTSGAANDDLNGWFRMRAAEGTFSSQKMGKVSAGWGSNPSYGISDHGVGQTNMVSDIWAATNAEGFSFRYDNATKNTGTTVNTAFGYKDAGRGTRVRYDSPTFGGAKLSVAFLHAGGQDYAFNFSKDFSGVSFTAGLGYFVDRTFGEAHDDSINGQISFNHKATGFNLGFAAGKKDDLVEGTDNPTYTFTKLGKVTANRFGSLAITGDYWLGKHYAQNDSTSTSYAFAVAQSMKGWNTEFHAAYQNMTLEGTGTVDNLLPISSVLVGTRIKF